MGDRGPDNPGNAGVSMVQVGCKRVIGTEHGTTGQTSTPEHFQKQWARARAIESVYTCSRVADNINKHLKCYCWSGALYTGCTHVSLPCTNSEFGFVVDKGTGTHVHHTKYLS